jgi:hypothetical protein
MTILQRLNLRSVKSVFIDPSFYGFIFGVSGTALLAFKMPVGYSFACYLVANIAIILWCLKDSSRQFLLIQTLFYTFFTLIGIYNLL